MSRDSSVAVVSGGSAPARLRTVLYATRYVRIRASRLEDRMSGRGPIGNRFGGTQGAAVDVLVARAGAARRHCAHRSRPARVVPRRRGPWRAGGNAARRGVPALDRAGRGRDTAGARARPAVVPRGAGSGCRWRQRGRRRAELCLDRMATVPRSPRRPASRSSSLAWSTTSCADGPSARAVLRADPSSRDWCTIGGNVATNAGGLCCVKYGVTRDSVLALEVGSRTGGCPRGPPQRQGRRRLRPRGDLVGARAPSGVVTEVTVRLRPLPPPAITVVAVCPDLEARAPRSRCAGRAPACSS